MSDDGQLRGAFEADQGVSDLLSKAKELGVNSAKHLLHLTEKQRKADPSLRSGRHGRGLFQRPARLAMPAAMVLTGKIDCYTMLEPEGSPVFILALATGESSGFTGACTRLWCLP